MYYRPYEIGFISSLLRFYFEHILSFPFYLDFNLKGLKYLLLQNKCVMLILKHERKLCDYSLKQNCNNNNSNYYCIIIIEVNSTVQ